MMRGHLFHCSLSTQRMAMRTELARRAGGWQNECAIWNDLEFGVRLLMNTQNVRKLHGDPQVVIHPHASDSITGMCYRDRAGLHEKSLNVIDSHFRHADHSLYHLWVECRRMILAAMYAREGEKERARAIRRDVASRNRGSDNLKLRTVYAVQRVLGHGGSATAIRLFRATAPKAK